ncbi:MAG: hypothetical protein JNJ57_13160 [Saprospiraceae bacterium]|nr:hypothetical protein [Saprospiraceae bacterium]
MKSLKSLNNSNPNNKDFKQAFYHFLLTCSPESKFRLAPTPSGFLHIGNALNFMLTWKAARTCGGKVLLRIDDLDADRKRPEYLADIFESLQWLGIDWDEGPGLHTNRTDLQIVDFEQHWSQHHRIPAYTQLLEKLLQKDLLFPCNLSRSQLAPYNGNYPTEFRNQDLDFNAQGVSWRIKTEGIQMQDFIVRRRDGLPSYQIASFSDDLHFGITHIIRGADLEPSTVAQQFMATKLQEPQFLNIQFIHHPLMLDENGQKLSKSAGSASLKSMRENGVTSAEIWRLSEAYF